METFEMNESKVCHITVTLELSHLVISASYPGRTRGKKEKQVTRGKDSIDQINNLSRIYRSLVTLRSFAGEEDRGVISLAENLGKQLYTLFFKGLEDFLEPGSNLIIEHSLFLLPLELAFDGEEFVGLRYSVGNWIRKLGETYKQEQQTFPSSLSLKGLDVLLLGDESENVCDAFSSEKTELFVACKVLKRTRSWNLMRQLEEHPYSIIHMACHGSFDEANPEQSFLILDQEEAGRSESALLRYDQIQQTRFSHTPLVFLNACHIGRVKENYLGFVGFADGLLEAGATNCITTLWSVTDQSASRFATDFYTRMLEGFTLGQALREARIRCWEEKRDILTSLSYILFGDPTTSLVSNPGQR